MKNLLKSQLGISFVVGLFSLSLFAESLDLKAERDAVKSACAAEAKTASCGDVEVGKGLLKCIHNFKKEHKNDFKFSDGCKKAMKGLKAHRREMMEKRDIKK